ncbi:MAG: adenylate/guanylate cyclase domain-containing protein [Saprospiraceae bacterium]
MHRTRFFDCCTRTDHYLSGMLSPQLKNFLHRTLHFDNPDPEITYKRILGLLMVVMVMVTAVCYNLAYEVLGYALPWWPTLCYCGATVAGLAWLLYSGDYFFFKHLQFVLLLLLPPAVQALHGGFQAGSGFVLVAFLAPLGALIFNEWRAARYYFAAFIVLQFACGLFEYFSPDPVRLPDMGVSILFFELNFIVTTGIVYYLMDRSLKYQTELQAILQEEHRKSDALISNLLPRETAEELKSTGYARAKSYPTATVMFTDFVEFSSFVRSLRAVDLVEQIDYYFSAFDEIIRRHGLEKIKTVGDMYMCAGGLPTPKASHAHDMIAAALDIRRFVDRHRDRQLQRFGYPFDMRIGIHNATLLAGVVGNRKIAYDIWGETVNIASRIGRLCEPGQICISAATHELVASDFPCRFGGRFPAKHIGEVDIYYVAD